MDKFQEKYGKRYYVIVYDWYDGHFEYSKNSKLKFTLVGKASSKFYSFKEVIREVLELCKLFKANIIKHLKIQERFENELYEYILGSNISVWNNIYYDEGKLKWDKENTIIYFNYDK